MRSSLRTLARRLRDAWLILGLSVALLALVELASRGVLAVCAPAPLDGRAQAAAHGGAPWAAAVFAELHEADSMRWEPYVGWRRRAFAGEHLNLDAGGLRRTLPPAAIGAPRVFFFGGSTIWGTGARDRGTIPSLVARATGWDARNYGEAGYVSTQERFLLELELQRGERPDVAIFYDGANDVFAAFQTRRGGLPQNEQFREREFNLTKSPGRLLRETVAAAVRQSGTLAAVRRLVGEGPSPLPLPAAERDRLALEVARAYTRNVADLVALGRARGIRVVCFLQPVIFTKRALAPDEEGLAAGHAWVRDLYLASYRRIREERPPSWHDLSDAFGDDPTPRFFDFCHLAESGNEVIAARMLAALGAP